MKPLQNLDSRLVDASSGLHNGNSVRSNPNLLEYGVTNASFMPQVFLSEFNINDLPEPVRNFLSKKVTLEEVSCSSGATVKVAGSYIPPEETDISGLEPLHLKIQASKKQNIDRATQRIRVLVQHAMNLPKYKEKVLIGLEMAPPSFDVRGKVLGPGGANLQYITNETGAIVTLRGRGSGFIEPTTGLESIEPLHLCVENNKYDILQAGRQLAFNLIETVQQEWFNYQQQHQPPVPTSIHSNQPSQQSSQGSRGQSERSRHLAAGQFGSYRRELTRSPDSFFRGSDDSRFHRGEIRPWTFDESRGRLESEMVQERWLNSAGQQIEPPLLDWQASEKFLQQSQERGRGFRSETSVHGDLDWNTRGVSGAGMDVVSKRGGDRMREEPSSKMSKWDMLGSSRSTFQPSERAGSGFQRGSISPWDEALLLQSSEQSRERTSRLYTEDDFPIDSRKRTNFVMNDEFNYLSDDELPIDDDDNEREWGSKTSRSYDFPSSPHRRYNRESPPPRTYDHPSSLRRSPSPQRFNSDGYPGRSRRLSPPRSNRYQDDYQKLSNESRQYPSAGGSNNVSHSGADFPWSSPGKSSKSKYSRPSSELHDADKPGSSHRWGKDPRASNSESRPLSSSRISPEGSNTHSNLDVAVMDERFIKLTAVDVDKIIDLIKGASRKTKERHQFEFIGRKSNDFIFVVRPLNMDGMKWLLNFKFHSSKYTAFPYKDIFHNMPLVRIYAFDNSLKITVKEVFDELERLNEGLNVKSWDVIRHQMQKKRLFILFRVDKMSFLYLQKICWKPKFFKSKLVIKAIKNRT